MGTNAAALLRPLAFCLALAVTLLSAPPAGAETIGVIMTRGTDLYEASNVAFLTELDHGGVLGRARVITQTPYPDAIAWSNAARKLIALDVDLIVAYGAPASAAVLKERSSIPLVSVALYEPLARGLEGRKATYVCVQPSLPAALRYLADTGTLQHLGVLYSSIEEDSALQLARIRRYAVSMGFDVLPINVLKAADTAKLMFEVPATAFFITSSSAVGNVNATVLKIAHGRGLPTVSFVYDADADPTILLAPDPGELGRETAERVLAFLRGSSVREIPGGCARTVRIVFNLKEARELGIRIPMHLVTEATRILE
jgi:putative ABC transport system substrate-binding protein